MRIQSFKDLVVWQKASDFSVEVYNTLSDIRDFSFKDQVQRAAISIPNNIAEGYARKSDKAFRNFLFISKGSAAEVESLLSIAVKLGYISPERQTHLTNRVHEIYKLLNGFIKKL
jgi:four helix bundle protein